MRRLTLQQLADQVIGDCTVAAGERMCSDEERTTMTSHARARDEEPAPGEPPYQGLHYFDEADADRFFGRERLTQRLVKRLEAESFLAVVGASARANRRLSERVWCLSFDRLALAWCTCLRRPRTHRLS
jgi:hypothetical protein